MKLTKKHSAFARMLSLLLLGFIVYGTTVEAAHTHAGFRSASNAVGAASFSDPATDTKTSRTLPGCGDCLICQLHQHFSVTLVSAPSSLVAAALRSRFFNLTAVPVDSQTTTPRRGRAPPFTL